MNITLPQWLDDLIFNDLSAKYCCSGCDMTVIDWDKDDVLNYLGTYFPRSYAESVCIFGDYFASVNADWEQREELCVFDFGCGTGGEIVGLLTAIGKALPNVRLVHVHAFDGNQHALRLLEKILKEMETHLSLKIDLEPMPYRIDDFYDLSLLDDVLTDQYDILMTFKAVCEFVTKEQFEKGNPYASIIEFMLSKKKKQGILVLDDVTSFNKTAKEWLPVMMDKGLAKAKCNVVMRNEGYNHQFTVSHSHKVSDVSKVAWRIIE